MAFALLIVSPAKHPRSLIPFSGVHKKAWFTPLIAEIPTTCPALLMPLAMVVAPPGSVPRSSIPVSVVPINAWRTLFETVAHPTTWPKSLMQLAEALLPLGSVPRSFIAMEKVGVKYNVVDALDNWNGKINNNDMKVTIDTATMGFFNKTVPSLRLIEDENIKGLWNK